MTKKLLKSDIKIAVAMSGGVDSTYAAFLLNKAGFDVIGMTAKFYHPIDGKQYAANIESIQHNTQKIGIKHFHLDLTAVFKKKIIAYYLYEYQHGRTPNPCVLCNYEMKFGLFLEKMLQKGAHYIATGHYAQIKATKGGKMIFKAKDKSKDQSYFLWKLPKAKLNQIIFPLGNRDKKDIIKQVKNMGFQIPGGESQDICFLAGQTNQQFLRKYLHPFPGDIINQSGKILGQHSGLFNYTIGQRHSLGVNSPRPLYVIKLNSQDNTILVGSKNDLLGKEFDLEETNWFVDNPEKIKHLKVKTRYHQEEVGCQLDGHHVRLEKSLSAITPGQSAVFYSGNQLIGGGIIKKTF